MSSLIELSEKITDIPFPINSFDIGLSDSLEEINVLLWLAIKRNHLQLSHFQQINQSAAILLRHPLQRIKGWVRVVPISIFMLGSCKLCFDGVLDKEIPNLAAIHSDVLQLMQSLEFTTKLALLRHLIQFECL